MASQLPALLPLGGKYDLDSALCGQSTTKGPNLLNAAVISSAKKKETKRYDFCLGSISKQWLLKFLLLLCISPDVILCGWLGLKHQLTYYNVYLCADSTRDYITAKNNVQSVSYLRYIQKDNKCLKSLLVRPNALPAGVRKRNQKTDDLNWKNTFRK